MFLLLLKNKFVKYFFYRSPTDINPQYPPNSNALNNSSSFRPINNISTYQSPISQQPVQAPKPQKPRTNHLLNAGGETRY